MENPSVVLDAWHKAAATGSEEKYFGFFKDSASIFMGTDATERWTIDVFKIWAKPAFEDGEAWIFEPFSRFLYFSADSSVVWFDEDLKTAKMGVLRGSGVLEIQNGEWKIVHYNLSVPIPNAIVKDVVNQIENLNQESRME
jgi:hypothetical protein